jgi:hypothetical protein
MDTTKLERFLITAVAWWIAQLPPTEQKTEAFNASCRSYILDKYMKPQETLTLSTDYTPDSSLASICVDAGIDPARVAFTQKAVMVLNFKTMSIACSTGNEEQTTLEIEAA